MMSFYISILNICFFTLPWRFGNHIPVDEVTQLNFISCLIDYGMLSLPYLNTYSRLWCSQYSSTEFQPQWRANNTCKVGTHLRREPGSLGFGCWWHQSHVVWLCVPPPFSSATPLQDTVRTWQEISLTEFALISSRQILIHCTLT